MTRLSVNINKIAVLRNARNGNLPDLLKAAVDCERFGAEGITVHPRPDERHIRFQDVLDMSPIVTTEFNIEGYPSPEWLSLVKRVKPAQATLVPDEPGQITSDHGWDTIKHQKFLIDTIAELKAVGCRVSLFIDPVGNFIENAARVGSDRIEFYTGPYAEEYYVNPEKAIQPYLIAAKIAAQQNLGLNAGHDLNLDNLRYLVTNIPEILEVSIGHALISDALYYGLENTIQMYLRELS